MRKAYASQESVAETLTAAERAAPFQMGEIDQDPLPKRTRNLVLADDKGVCASVEFDRRARKATVHEIEREDSAA